jgi:hypothetical protein
MISLNPLKSKKNVLTNENVWYSDEKRMKNIWKLFVMNDKGTIKIYKKKLNFIGIKKNLSISNIKKIYLDKQTPSYGTHSISLIVCIICIFYTFMILLPIIEYFLVFLIMIIVLFPVSLFNFQLNWIGIEYLDDGITKKVFFTDGSAMGWKNAIIGSDSLYNNIKTVEIIDTDEFESE